MVEQAKANAALRSGDLSDTPSEEVIEGGMVTTGRRRSAASPSPLPDDDDEDDDDDDVEMEPADSPQPADFAELAEQEEEGEAALAADKRESAPPAVSEFLRTRAPGSPTSPSILTL